MNTTKNKVTVEVWLDGSMAYAEDHDGMTAAALREHMCPTALGWEHFVDEGYPAAKKARAVYLFR